MPDRHELEALFLAHRDAIVRIAGAQARRHGLTGVDAEDFVAWVELRLVEGDYAILGKFRGRSALTTYVTVVVAMLYRDFRVQRWGRWRPSAAALRRGALAVQLETLVRRDGLPLGQAAELLRTAGRTTASDRELAALLAELPARRPLRPVEVGDEPLAVATSPDGADAALVSEAAEAAQSAADLALRRAVERLPPEDRLIVRMRFWDGMGVAEIARALAIDQKPLYRRVERLLAELRQVLEAAGISREQVRALLDEQVA